MTTPRRNLLPLVAAVLSLGAAGFEETEAAPPTFVGCFPPREDVERTTQHGDTAIQQALIVLGQPVNPIRVVGRAEIRELYARMPAVGAPPAGLDAFRAPGDLNDPMIYVNRDSVVYRRALSRASPFALLKLAAMLVHEQVHNSDGEHAAYRLQSDFVRGRLRTLDWRRQEEARLYVQGLDVRAMVLQRYTSGHRAACGLSRP